MIDAAQGTQEVWQKYVESHQPKDKSTFSTIVDTMKKYLKLDKSTSQDVFSQSLPNNQNNKSGHQH